jgi:hypothetical protein
MVSLFPAAVTDAARSLVSRRQWLAMSALSGGGGFGIAASALGMAQFLNSGIAVADSASRRSASAKSCISIFLCGGPSQPDLWDMKPDAPVGVRSEFRPIQTSVPGTVFGELIPKVARHADKLALIRSMTHDNNDHVGAIVHTLLGQRPPLPGQFYVDRQDHPGLGAILQKLLGNSGPLPAWVILPRHFETGSPAYKGQSAGFLGTSFDPLTFDKERKGSLSDAPLRIGALELPEDVDPQRLTSRKSLRRSLAGGTDAVSTSRSEEMFEQAYGLLSSPMTRNAFRLEHESSEIRDRYGRNEYGQSLLMARRLVESGVRFVNVFWTFFDSKGCQFNLWDNHGVPNDVCGIDGQLTGRQQLTHRYCTPSFDQSFSALLEDMTDRGLLAETLVTVSGEFGRTPKINATAGRDHWAHCYTQLLAGGGVQGGSIWGSSDAQGAWVRDAPVTPDDFSATILHAFGIDPDLTIPDQTGRPVKVTSGQPVTSLF